MIRQFTMVGFCDNSATFALFSLQTLSRMNGAKRI